MWAPVRQLPIPDLPYTRCVILNKLLSSCEPQFPHLLSGPSGMVRTSCGCWEGGCDNACKGPGAQQALSEPSLLLWQQPEPPLDPGSPAVPGAPGGDVPEPHCSVPKACSGPGGSAGGCGSSTAAQTPLPALRVTWGLFLQLCQSMLELVCLLLLSGDGRWSTYLLFFSLSA